MNKEKKMEDDPGFTQDNLMSYPLLKPIAFSNAIEDDYLSSGTWNVQNGQLLYYVASSTSPDRAGKTLGLTVRSISAKDLIFVDGLGRVGTAIKVQ